MIKFFKCLLICILPLTLAAQTTKKTAAKSIVKTKPVIIKSCHLAADTTMSRKLSLADIQQWADQLPLAVTCNGKEIYNLHQFTFTIILKSPLQTVEYGSGNDGIPILARKAIDKLQSGDTVFLREVTARDNKGAEIKMPDIVFSVL